MYLLGYYDETDCQITILETAFPKIEQAQAILREKAVKYLEQHGCDCAGTVLKKAQKEQGYYLDSDSEIEIMAEQSSVYIRMENQIPYFATFQILSIDNDEDKKLYGNDSSRQGINSAFLTNVGAPSKGRS